jgi:hypothetical protein
MSPLFALVACLGPSTALSSYADDVLAHLRQANTAWMTPHAAELKTITKAVGVLELTINAKGELCVLGLARASGNNDADDLMRGFVLAAEPLPPPPAEVLSARQTATCLLRHVLRPKDPALAVACFPGDKALPVVAGFGAPARRADDPGAALFAGWEDEGAGKIEPALAAYQKAVTAAPQWDYANRALGIALINAKKTAEAVPLLQLYLDQRGPSPDVQFFARELKRFAQFAAEREARRKNPRERIEKEDIALAVQDGLSLLEPCLEPARVQRLLQVREDTLVISFKVRQAGSVHTVHLEEPAPLLMTRHAECVEKAIEKWTFPPFTQGPELVVKRLPIKVKGALPPPPVVEAPAPKVSEELATATASMSQCERGQQEIMTYIQARFPALNRCLQAERARTPNVDMPPALPIAFVVAPSGMIERVAVNHRFFQSGPLFDCVVKAMSGRMAPSSGAACPAMFELNLRGL